MLKLVIPAAFMFLVVIALIIITQTFILLIALVSSSAVSTYLLVALKRQKRDSEKRPLRVPSIVLYLLMAVPVVIASLYIFEGFNAQSIYSIIVAFGMTLTFMYNLVTVPLAIYHKTLEKMTRLPLLLPLATIIVPAFNEERTMAGTIESIIEADYPNKELIVVDDGSTDNTFAVASRYISKMPRGMMSVVRKPNGGKSSAINYALRYARGDFIVVVDADSKIGRDSIKEMMKYFQYPDVVAVGGNIKVLNRVNLLTYCQELEYLIGINMFKRGFDIFGTVMVVPGALGGFRKKVLVERGDYDNDTLTEDFDATVKALKTGKGVQASSFSISYTDAPETLRGLYKQRVRWNRGNTQTLIKHRDVVTTPRYGMLRTYGYPVILLTMVLLPFLGIVVSIFTVLAIIQGQGLFILITFLMFTAMQFLLAIIAIIMDDEEWKLALVSPLFVIGYKQILDVIIAKSVLDVIFRKNLKWTSAKASVKEEKKSITKLL